MNSPTVSVTESSEEQVKFPSEFGIPFQETIIYCILTDVRFANDISEILEPAFFKTIYLSTLSKAIFKFRGKYHVIPSVDVLRGYVAKEINDPRLKSGILDILDRIFTDDMMKSGAGYVKENALNFCRVKSLKNALLKAYQATDRPNPNFDQVSRIVRNGLKITSNAKLTEYKKTFMDRVRAVNETVPRIPTGLDRIDADVLRGGLPVKKYGIVITFTSGGKTHMLVHLGASALLAGKTVLHLSLEDDENDVSLRYDSNISGIASADFLLDVAKQRVVQDIIEKVPGKLFIKEYPGRTVTAQMIRNLIERMIENGNKPDLVLVDYISEMQPDTKRERRHELAEVSRDFRATAVEYELALWTAAQSQRYTTGKKIVKLDQIAESHEIVHPADFCLTIGQNHKDAEDGVCKLYVAKNKTGIDGHVYVANFQKHLSRFAIKDQIDASSLLDMDSSGFNLTEQ